MADMALNAAFMEQTKEFRAILENALSMETGQEIKDILEGEFKGAYSRYCEFIGFCREELRGRAEEIGPQVLAALANGMAMAGLMIGWGEGLSVSHRREPAKE